MAIYRRSSASSRYRGGGDPVIREASVVLLQAAALLAAPEDDDDVPFQQILRSPDDFGMPDLSRTKRLDREQEAQGLDDHRRVEDVEAVGMPVRQGGRRSCGHGR